MRREKNAALFCAVNIECIRMNPTGTPTLPDVHEDTESAGKIELKHLADSIQELWAKARRVADFLLQVRAENSQLKTRNAELERSERETKSRLEQREQELHKLRTELVQLQSNGNSIYSKEEKDELKTKIKELISKINSRL
jgi:chromosome segregation ATPase